MNIQVRVLSRQAQTQIAALQGQVAALQRQLAASSGASAGATAAQAAFGGMTVANERRLVRMGNQLQWTGRQLEHNFTLPLLLAAGAATKFQMDNEAAMTRVAKVYGDGTMAAQVMTNELNALGKAFQALSERFGVNQAETIDIASQWAAAGASGVALARVTEQTLRTMVLGQMEAKEATEALIAIQAQYGLSSTELTDVIAQLNIIENQTGVSLRGLVQAYSRAAGVARSAGVDTRHLGAMIAAMSPAAGSAAQAGNALKTIISRLLAPTKEAVEVMGLMGVNVADLDWKSLNATQRLELMAKKFNALDDAQKAVVSAVIASRYQINKFDVLMREMIDTQGFYNRALEATADRTRYFRVAQDELNRVLESNPQKFKIIWVMIQNAMANVIQPLIPLMLAVADSIRIAFQWFANLPPEVQKLSLAFLVLLALIGPISRYVGSLTSLIGVLGVAFLHLGGAITGTARFLAALMMAPFSLIGTAVGAIGGAAITASRGLWVATAASIAFVRTWSMGAVIAALRAVPGLLIAGGVAAVGMAQRLLALVGVARVVFAVLASGVARALIAAIALRNLPAIFMMAFMGARTVIMGFIAFVARAGVMIAAALGGPVGIAVVGALTVLYAFRDRIGQWINEVVGYWNQLPAGVANAIHAVVQVVANAAMQVYEWLSYLNPFARHSPSLVDQVKAGMKVIKDEYGRIRVINPVLDSARLRLAGLKVTLRDQQGVVNSWRKSLDTAQRTLEAARDRLEQLRDAASRLGDELQAAKERLDFYANAPIQGMRAMEDQIFANEMAQKRLRLEIMRIEDSVGPLDQLQNKMQAISGEIELLQGKQAGLRAAGAGSDILRSYDQQIAGLRNQQKAIGQQAKPLEDLQRQLEELQRTGERLDLERSLKFDPLIRQIDQLANGLQELPFDVIMAGVRANRAEVDRLQRAYDAANAAVKRQEGVVDAAEKAHDAIQRRFENEKRALDDLNLRYNRYNDQVQQAARAASDAANKARGGRKPRELEMSPGAENFLASKGGNFPEVGGTGMLGRELPNIKDQSALIDEYTKGIAQQTSDMFKQFDMFAPIRNAWNKGWEWVRNNVAPVVAGVVSAIRDGFSGSGDFFQGVRQHVGPLLRTLQDIGQTIWTAIGRVWRLLGPEVKKTVNAIKRFLLDLWNNVGPQMVKFGELWDPFVEALGHLWQFAKPILGLLGALILLMIKTVWSTVNGMLVPAFEMIAKVLGNVVQVVVNVVKLVLAIINGDWKAAWQAAQQIVAGMLAAVGNIIKGAGKIIWGAVKGLLTGVLNFFKWLWDELVGHSIVPDMIMAIIAWFGKLPGLALKAIISLGPKLFAWARDSWNSGWDSMKSRWKAIGDWLNTLPANAVAKMATLSVKLGTWARDAWNNGWAKMKERVGVIWTWLGGLPESARLKVYSLIAKLGTLGTDAMKALGNGLKSWWDKSIFPWFGKLAPAAGRALSGIGGAVANAVKAAVKGAFDWMNKNIIGRVNSVTGKFGVTIPELPKFARGGVIPGKETKKDSVIIAARPGEGILVPEAVRGLGGGRGIAFLNKMFSRGHRARAFGALQGDLQHFDLGGIVRNIGSKFKDWVAQGAGFALDNLLKPVGGAVREIMPNGFAEDYLVSIIDRWRNGARSWGKKVEETLGGGVGNIGPQAVKAVQAWIKQQYAEPYVWGATGPNSWDCSGLVGAVYGLLRGMKGAGNGARYFTTTSIGSGVPGLKPGIGPGLAIGVTAGTGHMAGNLAGLPFEATPPRVRIGSAAKPVIQFARKYHYDGSSTATTAGGRGRAFDQGGYMLPGLNWNGTRKPEPVLTTAQWDAVMAAERTFAAFTRDMLKSGPTSLVAAANARARGGTARASDRIALGTGGGDLVVHIHGDLSFPNINNSSSAENFLKNLETMARK